MARMKVSDTLIAEMLQKHWPWPEGTTVTAPDDQPEGKYVTEFEVDSDALDLGAEVTPVWRRAEDGSIAFVSWNP